MMSHRERSTRAFAAFLLLSLGCITINLYFPVAELQDAAAEIVSEVRPQLEVPVESPAVPPADPMPIPPSDPLPDPLPDLPDDPLPDLPDDPPSDLPPGDGGGKPSTPGTPEPSGKKEAEASAGRGTHQGASPRYGFTLFRSSVAYAAEDEKGGGERKDEKKVKIEISTPVIRKIKETLKKRFPKLVPLYEAGALGEGWDGYLAEREKEKLNLKQARDLAALLEAENEDRKNLYAEIARANGIGEEKIPDIGQLFSVEWQKAAKAGWWIERGKDRWEKKPAERKPEKKKAPQKKN
ncbi:MAG TPA: DUF1318 domain-containing protein [Planctomycetota bacterium]|nr:DUF1318 domain-containing protein [Planctomycetota bacterium]